MTSLDLLAIAVLGLAVVIALGDVARQLGRIVDRLDQLTDRKGGGP